MIIDVHTHAPTHRTEVPDAEREINTSWRPDKTVVATVTWQDYIAAMAPVDRACVFGIRYEGGLEAAGGSTAAQSSGIPYGPNVNDDVATFARAFPDKLIGFMSVHPDEPNVVDEMERCYHDLGLRGIKLGPNYQMFDPLSTQARLVYETAQRLAIPAVFHQGTSPVRSAPLRYAHPLVMDEIATAFPEWRIVMAHLGHPWQADTFMVIRKHPHVYADISSQYFRPWSQYHALRLATEWGVLDKLVFGTDYPISTAQETIDGLLAVNRVIEGSHLPAVPEDALHRIIERDSLALLGLPDA
jgi:predicted TIM-barrel fold metal-dependent hydrolase